MVEKEELEEEEEGRGSLKAWSTWRKGAGVPVASSMATSP
jgi:hypothetical protein